MFENLEVSPSWTYAVICMDPANDMVYVKRVVLPRDFEPGIENCAHNARWYYEQKLGNPNSVIVAMPFEDYERITNAQNPTLTVSHDTFQIAHIDYENHPVNPMIVTFKAVVYIKGIRQEDVTGFIPTEMYSRLSTGDIEAYFELKQIVAGYLEARNPAPKEKEIHRYWHYNDGGNGLVESYVFCRVVNNRKFDEAAIVSHRHGDPLWQWKTLPPFTSNGYTDTKEMAMKEALESLANSVSRPPILWNHDPSQENVVYNIYNSADDTKLAEQIKIFTENLTKKQDLNRDMQEVWNLINKYIGREPDSSDPYNTYAQILRGIIASEERAREEEKKLRQSLDEVKETILTRLNTLTKMRNLL